jgi:hypothetical protein
MGAGLPDRTIYDKGHYHIWKGNIMPYQVKLVPTPHVIDQNGQTVTGSKVLSVEFPSQSYPTAEGDEHFLTGPGKAVIRVGKVKIHDVPLC